MKRCSFKSLTHRVCLFTSTLRLGNESDKMAHQGKALAMQALWPQYCCCKGRTVFENCPWPLHMCHNSHSLPASVSVYMCQSLLFPIFLPSVSVCECVWLSLCVHVWVSLSLCMFVCQSIFPPSVCVYVCLSISLSLCVCLSFSLPLCVYLSLCMCLSISLSLCVCICVS